MFRPSISCSNDTNWFDCSFWFSRKNCHLRYDLQLCFMLVLFHDKKCCNCINFVPCILWDFIILSLVLSWWRIEHEMKIGAVSRLARKKFARKVLAKRSCKKHMLESEETSVRLHFVSTLWDRPSRKVPVKLSTWRILSVTFVPFTYTIYTLITHKSKGDYSERKP